VALVANPRDLKGLNKKNQFLCKMFKLFNDAFYLDWVKDEKSCILVRSVGQGDVQRHLLLPLDHQTHHLKDTKNIWKNYVTLSPFSLKF